MPNAPEPQPLPTDLAAAHAMILAERAARLASEIAVERLKLEVARLRRERFGTSSERSARIDQLELVLEDLEETLAETQAQAAAEPEALSGAAFSRRKLARRPLPEHLPRERIVHPGPTTCACCGGTRLRPLGEDVTETLERIPARWAVIQHVRERFSCSDCETIAQTPAPFHPIPRGRAGADGDAGGTALPAFAGRCSGAPDHGGGARSALRGRAAAIQVATPLFTMEAMGRPAPRIACPGATAPG
ncbi:IS66 family transposase [Methylobacterium sp. 092160098-2]|uniref:IS66 family transposase n=1 Tax=Methylobacterium sp. 092160098-2 TaxID=3025129 RepID=UPI00406C44B3